MFLQHNINCSPAPCFSFNHLGFSYRKLHSISLSKQVNSCIILPPCFYIKIYMFHFWILTRAVRWNLFYCLQKAPIQAFITFGYNSYVQRALGQTDKSLGVGQPRRYPHLTGYGSLRALKTFFVSWRTSCSQLRASCSEMKDNWYSAASNSRQNRI